MDSAIVNSNHTSAPKSTFTLEEQLREARERREEILLYTGPDARRTGADLAELRKRRREAIGACLFKRAGSPYWQFRYAVGERLVYQSSGTTDKREAERWLNFKLYEASEGKLPGTATVELVIEAFLNDARVRGLRSQPRLKRATKALLNRLAGLRAEQVSYDRLLKYAAERGEEVQPDTLSLEIAVMRRALRLAHQAGLIRVLPAFPRVAHLRVRQGFFDPAEWASVRAHLSDDFRDACDLAYASGWREMEVLTLRWANVPHEAREIRLAAEASKTGAVRKVEYTEFPHVVDVIERRAQVREQLQRAGVISPYVFCFRRVVVVHGRTDHRAGETLFRATGNGGMLDGLRNEWRRACDKAGYPGRVFHDLRRSAARNFERAGVPRSVGMKMGGWSERMYSRYAIGAESELSAAGAKISAYFERAGWHSVGTRREKGRKSRGIRGCGGRI